MKSRKLSETSWKPSALPWWKLRRRAASAVGHGYAGSPDLRLWMLAVGRVGPWGHACFDPGELRDLLVKVIRKHGELGTYSERGLRNLIDELVAAELLSPASNTRCLVIPMEVLDSQKAIGRITCPEHRCSHVWSTDLAGWVAVKADGTLNLTEYAQHLRAVEAA